MDQLAGPAEVEPKANTRSAESGADCRLKMLMEVEKQHRENGVLLWLVGLNPGVLATVQQLPLGQALGHDRMFFNLEQAVDRYLSLPAQSGTR